MRRLNRHSFPPHAALLLSLLAAACSSPPPPDADAGVTAPATAPPATAPPATAPPEGLFFDQDALFKDATDPQKDIDQVPCAGEAADGSDSKAFHPQKIRGTVWAPFGAYAWAAPPAAPRPVWQRLLEGALDPLTTTAHAHPLPQEKAVANVIVRLAQVDGEGKIVRELLQVATDDQGRYCFRVPDGVEIKPDLIVYAGEGATLQRRNVASRSTNDLFSQPEALFRVLIKRKIDMVKLPRQEYGNLYSLTDTIVDSRTVPKPLDLPPGTRIKQACALVQQRLEAHDRFKTKMDELAAKYPR